MNTASKRAAHGAEMLDYARPGWHREIDLDTLDVQSTDTCVLGQLYGDYDWGTEQLGIETERAVSYGFYLTSRRHSYWLLNRAWRREIRARLDDDAARGPGTLLAWYDELRDFPATERESELLSA